MGRAQPGVDDACRSSATAQVDAVMLAARVLVAITAQSVAALEAQVTLPQLRVLAMVASDGPLNLGAVARGLGVHPSNATRACDRLVAAGLLHRGEDAVDRRNLILELTAAGRQLVQTVIRHRRASIQDVLSRMSGEHRRELVPTLNAFARAAGEIPNSEPWVLGWTTERPAGDNVAIDDRTT
ncbi:MAG TPA: MarR family transcriptional regulator [Pseudonocardiaceae bacterium]|jgi:DNA-binding MarR family transcriptional regulator|nr:MarR family transcriptional regulator [Pseudonocardiaceae bacterium]